MPVSRSLNDALFRALRFGFRLLPMQEATRDAWRQKFLDRYSAVRPLPAQGQASATARTRRPRVASDGRAIGYVPYRQEALPSPMPATLVAFYLPQFHTIPENDAWWGEGFTEWRNVTRALPQFEGHAQPRLPGSLGYYDLANPDTLRKQAKLAQEYGIGAFCCYFYWFGGKTLLEQPLQQWLHDPSITLPVCLCWANENWTRSWDGRAEDVLIEQQHSPEDDLAFIAHVAPYLRDPRYLRVDGKPMLLVYRPGLLPDAKATAMRWRQWCTDNDVGEIFIAYVQSFERPDPRDLGFDAAVEFPPNLSTPTDITASQRLINDEYSGQALDWRELAADYSRRPMPDYRLFPGVNCGWDNEPRRPGKGRTYLHAAPRRYRDWLQTTITSRLADVKAGDRFVFINAWNEWAEGAVLEPDTRLGHAWLQATRAGLDGGEEPADSRPRLTPLCVVVHAWYPDVFDEILAALEASGLSLRLIVTTTPEKAEQIHSTLDERNIYAEVDVFENRGRDIRPFLHVADRLLNEGVQVVLKLHTKRSPHRFDGDSWRNELIARLVSPERAEKILQAFDRSPALGLVAPEGHVQPLTYYWGANKDNVGYRANRIGITNARVNSDTFVSGSMFWARLEGMRPLLDAHLADWEFPMEAAQLDGTLAHAIERTFILCLENQGLRIGNSASVSGQSELHRPTSYEFASRG